ncbi:hypothetical protein IB691_01000 [Fangia hongkongensis]|nr:hypothetical protein [Fangia hongkongensis]
MEEKGLGMAMFLGKLSNLESFLSLKINCCQDQVIFHMEPPQIMSVIAGVQLFIIDRGFK